MSKVQEKLPRNPVVVRPLSLYSISYLTVKQAWLVAVQIMDGDDDGGAVADCCI